MVMHIISIIHLKKMETIQSTIMKKLQSSAVIISSGDDFKGIFDKSDDINKLMKDLHSENDEIFNKNEINKAHMNVDIQQKPAKFENKFEESGQLVLDTMEFEKLIGENNNHHQASVHQGKQSKFKLFQNLFIKLILMIVNRMVSMEKISF